MTASTRLAPCCLLALISCRKPAPTLGLLVWEGYADPSFVRAFEEKCQCKVSASYMGSSDELVAKLRGGSASNYDVISPSSDVATMIATTGLAAPLDLVQDSCVLATDGAPDVAAAGEIGGNVYGVPFQWGPNPLLYDTTAFPASARKLECALGSEAARQDFGLGRSLHGLHGGAGAGIRQARSACALQSHRRAA